jgi:hypothetical protein
MNYDDIVEWLREYATELPGDWFPVTEELEILRQYLPTDPLPEAVLDRVLQGLRDFQQSRLLCHLGRLGRMEVLVRLRIGATWEKDANSRLHYAEGLAHLRACPKCRC